MKICITALCESKLTPRVAWVRIGTVREHEKNYLIPLLDLV